MNVLANSRGPEALRELVAEPDARRRLRGVLVGHRIPARPTSRRNRLGQAAATDAGVTSYTAVVVHSQVKEGHRVGIIGLCALE